MWVHVLKKTAVLQTMGWVGQNKRGEVRKGIDRTLGECAKC